MKRLLSRFAIWVLACSCAPTTDFSAGVCRMVSNDVREDSDIESEFRFSKGGSDS